MESDLSTEDQQSSANSLKTASKLASESQVIIESENDWLLEHQIRKLNGTDDEMAMTLIIDGLLVSGLLVGGNRYFQAILDGAHPPETEQEKESVKEFQSLIDFYIKDRSYPESQTKIGYVHMLSATYHLPNGEGSPILGKMFRAKLSRVSGFHLGCFMPKEHQDEEAKFYDLDGEALTN